MPKIDYSGRTIYRWTVIEPAEKPRTWVCRCSCGTIREIPEKTLRRKTSRSCGCYRDEVVAEIHSTHGMSNTPEYRTWQRMIQRCHNVVHRDYAIYGAKGIKVCDRWRESFGNFFTDMGYRPSPQHSIDRYPDQKGDYEPKNCRWATSREQNLNRCNNRLIEYRGRVATITEWAEEFGISVPTLANRLERWGNVEKSLETTIKRSQVFEHDGKALTAREWSAITGIPYQVIITRINKMGWPIAEALTIPAGKFMGRNARKMRDG